ncbi:1055_t:CDS:2, partial [Paraglomus occultum]
MSANELDYYSLEEDDIGLIEQYKTGYFIQDSMMYKPSVYFHHNIRLRCLDDLRKWNDEESEDRVIEDDGTSEIFEMWPERIRQYDERQI